MLGYSLWTSVRSGGIRWYMPSAGSKPETTDLLASSSVWTVVVGKLDILIELVPFLLPASHSTAVNTTAVGHCL